MYFLAFPIYVPLLPPISGVKSAVVPGLKLQFFYPYIRTCQAQEVFSQEVVSSQELEMVLEGLVVATEVESPEAVSLFPQDLGTTNNILNMTVDYLMQDLSSNPDNPLPLSTVS